MTAAVAAPASPRTAGRLRRWLSVRQSLLAEAALVLLLYGAYELARCVVAGGAPEALGHARDVVALEQSTGLLVEEHVQDAAGALPGLIALLGFSYLTLHLTVTAGVLLWLHQRRPAAFPLVRTALVLASGLALVGYLVYPTAPPRLAGIGIADTVSGGHVDLNSGLVSALYNPYAALPSMHIGYALVVAASLHRYARRRVVRLVVGPLYPLFVLLIVVATGNHFIVDALAGAVVTGVAGAAALLLARPARDGGLVLLHERPAPAQTTERLAA